MTEPDELLEEYRSLNDAYLLGMLANADDYHDDAVATMIRVLQERGIEAQRPPPETPAAKSERADDLAYSGRARVLWGGIFAAIGVALSVASGGRFIFYGLGLFGGVMLISGLSLKGKAEELEREVQLLETNEREEKAGLLSAADGQQGGVSFTEPPR